MTMPISKKRLRELYQVIRSAKLHEKLEPPEDEEPGPSTTAGKKAEKLLGDGWTLAEI